MSEIKTIFERQWNSHCKHDSKGHHNWEKLGVVCNQFGYVTLIWRCSQCGYILKEYLEDLPIYW